MMSLSLKTTVLRHYLVMAIVIIAGFSGFWPLAFLALPVFLSALLGVQISWPVSLAFKDKPDTSYKYREQRTAHS